MVKESENGKLTGRVRWIRQQRMSRINNDPPAQHLSPESGTTVVRGQSKN